MRGDAESIGFAPLIVALTIILPAAHLLFTKRLSVRKTGRYVPGALLFLAAVAAAVKPAWWAGVLNLRQPNELLSRQENKAS